MKSNEKKACVFLFHGDDGYSCNETLQNWKEKFIEKYGEDALEVVDGKTLDTSSFITNIESLPFLSEKRLTIVKDFLNDGHEEKQKKVAKHLAKAPDFNLIIFYESKDPDKRTSLYKALKKHGEIKNFPEKTPAETARWILEKAKQKEMKINFQTASHLCKYCGADLWKLSNELEKLKLFCGEKEVDEKTIEEICTPSLSASIFKLTDELAEKNEKEALKAMKNLLESGEDPLKIFFMIARHFRILVQVHEMVNKQMSLYAIKEKLNQHEFVIKKTSWQSKNFTFENLKSIYEKLLKIDIETKTGGIKSFGSDKRQFELAIEKFIIECCNMRAHEE